MLRPGTQGLGQGFQIPGTRCQLRVRCDSRAASMTACVLAPSRMSGLAGVPSTTYWMKLWRQCTWNRSQPMVFLGPGNDAGFG